MNKFLAKAMWIAALTGGFFVSQAEAGVQWGDSGLVRYVTPAAVGGSTAVVVIDRSDTTNYPHYSNSSLEIEKITIAIDQVAAGTSTVRVGVMTAVNASSGTVNWLASLSKSLNVSNTLVERVFSYAPNRVNTQVEGGRTPGFLTREQTTITPVAGSPLLFQTDIPLLTPRAGIAAAPEVGDLVAEINATSANAPVVSIDVQYKSKWP